MATLQARVEDFVGAVTDTDALSQWLTEGARVFIQALPPELLWTVSTDLTDAGAGVAVGVGRVLYAHKAGRYAIRISPSMKTAYGDVNSIWKATDFAPAYYIEHDTAYVLGDTDGGTVGVVAYPTIVYTDSTISSFPADADHLPVLFAAARVQQSRAYSTAAPSAPVSVTVPTAPTLATASYTAPVYGPPDIRILLNIPADETLTLPAAPGLSWSAPSISLPVVPTFSTFTISATAPTPPSLPTVAYIDAAVGSIGTTSIASLPAVPAFPTVSFGGSLSIPALPTLSFATKIDGVTSLTIPTVPTAPSITYQDAALGTWAAAATVGALPTIPTYPAAGAFGGNLADITNNLPATPDLQTKIDGITALTLAAAPAAPSISSAGVSATLIDFTGIVAPAYTAPSTTLTYTDWTTYFNSEDSEMMASVINKLGAELQEIRNEFEGARNEFEEDVEEYRALVQKAIEQAQITLQEQVTELQQTDRTALENYALSLQRYDRAIAEYQAHIDVQMKEVEVELMVAIQGHAEAQRLYVELYQADIAAARDEYGGLIADHQGEIQRLIEQARLDQQILSEKFAAETDMNIQNEIQTAQTDLAEYQLTLQRYVNEVDQYRLDVEHLFNEFQADYQKAIAPWVEQQQLYMTQYQADLQAAAAEYRGLMEDHMAEVQRLIEQAQLDQQRLITTAQLTTDLNLKNEAQTMAALVAEGEVQARVYEAQVRGYQIEVEAEIQDFVVDEIQIKMAKWQEEAAQALRKYEADITAETNRMRSASEAFLNETNALIREYEALTGRALAAYSAESEVLIAAFRADLDAATADWQAQIQDAQLEIENTRYANESATALFQAEVIAYQAEAQENLGIFEGEIQLFIQARQGYLADAEQLMMQFREGVAIYTERSYDAAKPDRAS